MENNTKFRNHISIVFEKIGAVGGAIIAFFILNLESIVKIFQDGSSGEIDSALIIGTLTVLGIIIVTIGYQLILWSKTYISVCDNSIVIERNTLNRRKNTIGIKNVSNVNTEQNLFEMIVGTCKVKLDTNSMSTADETDVKIVLKKKDAEAFKNYLMMLMQQNKTGEGSIADVNQDTSKPIGWQYEASSAEIMTHGFLAINIFSLLFAAGSFVGLIVMLVIGARKLAGGESVMGMFFGFLMLGGMWFSSMRDLLKGFIKYYDFKIARRGDKIYMQYGLLRKVNYTIPVEKINGLKLKQSLFARLTGRYMAEIINIGMGDDEAEAEAFLFPYCRKEMALSRVMEFLPEFDYAQNLEYEKQPKSVWATWICPFSAYLGAIAILMSAGLVYLSEYKIWILCAAALMVLIGILSAFMMYVTDGSRFGEDTILLVDGFLEKKYCFIPYRKIQYVEFNQNPIARCARIQKGSVQILASMLNRSQNIPYFSEADSELIKSKMLASK